MFWALGLLEAGQHRTSDETINPCLKRSLTVATVPVPRSRLNRDAAYRGA